MQNLAEDEALCTLCQMRANSMDASSMRASAAWLITAKIDADFAALQKVLHFIEFAITFTQKILKFSLQNKPSLVSLGARFRKLFKKKVLTFKKNTLYYYSEIKKKQKVV